MTVRLKEKTTNKTSKRHDGFLKQSMSHPKILAQVIERYIPQTILIQADLATIRPENTEFIAKNLKVTDSDVLFSLKWKNNRKGYFYFHVEHQSGVDQFITIRFLRYMTDIYEMHQKRYPKDKLAPLIYPTLIYTGKQKYTAPLSYWKIISDSELAKQCFPATDLNMVDVYRMNQQRIEEDFTINPQTGMFFYAMQSIHSKDIYEAMKLIEPVLKSCGDDPQDLHFYLSVVYYTLTEAGNTPNKDKLIELFKRNLREQDRDKVMTIADQIREEGISIGMEKGKIEGKIEERQDIARNLLNAQIAKETISSATGLSFAEIEEIKKASFGSKSH